MAQFVNHLYWVFIVTMTESQKVGHRDEYNVIKA